MEHMTRARARIVLEHPWLAALVLRLELKPGDADGSAYTDGRAIVYDPAFTDGLTPNQRVGLILHETLHCAFLHHARRDGREPKRWNIACDCAINGLLESLSIELLPHGVYHHTFGLPEGLSAEEYYNLLPPSSSGAGWGGVEDGPSDSTAQKEWRDGFADAIVKAKQQGVQSQTLDRMYDAYAAPKVDWRSLLIDELDRVKGQDDFSYIRPSRRGAALGLILPSLYSEHIPSAAIVLDTSGSISDKELSELLATVRSLLDSTVTIDNLHILCADSEITSTQECAAGEPVNIQVKGGGGTDFRPALRYMEENGIPIGIYLTDLMGTFPETFTGQLIWLATTNEIAPIGRTIRLRDYALDKPVFPLA